MHYTIYIGLSSKIHYQSLKQYFDQKDINYREVNEDDKLKEGINISTIDLNVGLDFKDEKLYVIGESEIFKQRFKSTISQFSRYKNAITINSVNELNEGDYLVHDHYGIGIYKGIETMLNNGVHRDYIKLEYKNSDKLYLPLEQFKLVRKYVSKEGAVPKINKLGSKEWEKTKARISERVNEIAEIERGRKF
jgi:transcription-repair coupling factor (superfamily II helicase)